MGKYKMGQNNVLDQRLFMNKLASKIQEIKSAKIKRAQFTLNARYR